MENQTSLPQQTSPKTNLLVKYWYLPVALAVVVGLVTAFLQSRGMLPSQRQSALPSATPGVAASPTLAPQSQVATEGAGYKTPEGDVNTGVIIKSDPAIDAVATQRNDLRDVLPITLSQFGMTYDARNVKFIVIINAPHEQNKEYFDSWLQDNYPLIPKEDFVIQVKEG